MGSSQSSLDSSSLNTNANLQNDLVSKCEEFSAQNDSRLWKGLSHALQKVSLSNEALENLSSLVILSHKDHDALLLMENLIFETMSSKDCKQDNSCQEDILTVPKENSDAAVEELLKSEENSISEGNNQFIIVNGNVDTEEKEQSKRIERRKSDIRRKNGKLMPPLSSQSPRTLHASPDRKSVV